MSRLSRFDQIFEKKLPGAAALNAPGALSESNTWDSELLKIKLENFSRKTDVSRNCEVSD